MKVSELVGMLQKVSQIVGDVPVVLKELASEAETEIKSLGVTLDSAEGSEGGTVTLQHATSTTPAAAPANEPPPPPES